MKDFRRLLRELLSRANIRDSLARLAEVSDRVLPEAIEAERRRLERQPLRLWCQLTGRRWRIEDYFGLFREIQHPSPEGEEFPFQ